MNSIRVQRLQKLENRESHTLRAIQWLEENQDRFRQPIFEPVCMSLNVLDPRYVKQTEAFFGGRDFYSFVAQNEEDRETFLKAVRTSIISKGVWRSILREFLRCETHPCDSRLTLFAPLTEC